MNEQRDSVLIVDDEPQEGVQIREDLSEHGFACWVATDPERARQLVDSQQFNALVANVRMPVVSCLELIDYVRNRCPECKVVLIAESSKRECLWRGLLLGACDYVEKPLRKEELIAVVSKAVRGEAGNPLMVHRDPAATDPSTPSRQASLDSVYVLVRAVEAKDPWACRHGQQVASYAVDIAKAMNLPAAIVELTRVASLLHDVGKIGVPGGILTKPGPLTEEEFQHIYRHPVLGAEILSCVKFLSREAQLVRHHHERWDGKGYPDGLAGEEIPLASRIINIADSIDAMLVGRAWRKGYPVDGMQGELIRCAGTQYDPRIAAAAFQWCSANAEKLFLPDKNLVLTSQGG